MSGRYNAHMARLCKVKEMSYLSKEKALMIIGMIQRVFMQYDRTNQLESIIQSTEFNHDERQHSPSFRHRIKSNCVVSATTFPYDDRFLSTSMEHMSCQTSIIFSATYSITH